MKALFDTSVLIPAMVEELTNHEIALERLSSALTDSSGCCTTHALAECYSTLTALPLSRRIRPDEAAAMIQALSQSNLNIVSLDGEDYSNSLGRVSRLGLTSGVIYDALHLTCAERIGCDQLFTYNQRDFQRLQPVGPKISPP